MVGFFFRQNSVDIVLVWLEMLKFGRVWNLSNKPWKTIFFIINIETSVFSPAQTLEWLGTKWDSKLFPFKNPERRISAILISIENILIIFLTS